MAVLDMNYKSKTYDKSIPVDKIISTVAIAFFSLTYLFSSVFNINYIIIFLMRAVYFGCCFLLRNTTTKKTMLKYAVLIMLLSLLYYFLTITSTVDINASYYNLKRFFVKFNQLFNFFFPILLLSEFFRLNNSVCQKIILIIVFSIFMYVVFHSFIVFRQNTDLSRNWEIFSELEEENVATYYFVYAAMSVMPMLFVMCWWKNNKILSAIAIACAILIFVFLLSAQYTLAIITPILCILFAILQKSKGFIKLLIFLCYILLFLCMPYILSIIAQWVESDIIKERLLAIIRVFNYGTITEGDPLSGRLELYKKCIEYFFRSPIIGNKTVPFDGHATFLTVLCDLGLIGTIPMYVLFWGSKNTIKTILKDENKYKDWIPCFIGMIITGFTNPIHAAGILGYALYFITPAILIFKNKRR